MLHCFLHILNYDSHVHVLRATLNNTEMKTHPQNTAVLYYHFPWFMIDNKKINSPMEKAGGISQCTTFHSGLYIWKYKELNKFGFFIQIEAFIWITYGQLQNAKADTVNAQTELNLFLFHIQSKKYYQGQSRDDVTLCISSWAPLCSWAHQLCDPLLTLTAPLLGQSLTWAYFALCDTEDQENQRGSQDLLVTPLFYWWTNTFDMAEKPRAL